MLTTFFILVLILFNKKNILVIIIGLEAIMIIVTYQFITISNFYNDVSVIIFSIFSIVIAGIESTIGLILVIKYYKLKGFITHNL